MSAQPTHEAHVTTVSVNLLVEALGNLEEAIVADRAGEKYVLAHLSALSAASALLAAYARPNTKKPTSAWVLVAKVVPEFSEWAAFFAAGAGKKAAAAAGLGGAVTPRQADDLVRDAYEFITLVAQKLGVTQQLVLPKHVKSLAQHQSQVGQPGNVIPLNRHKEA
ncbi:MAG: hypothetical protein KGQ38_04770 [Actinomycetales bacterium]|nr:hypothetical protein [Actinomycetales bacterium]